MKRIPRSRDVTQAFRGVDSSLKDSLKELNQLAGQLMTKGDYSGAEALAAKGREIQQFRAEVSALGKRWRELNGKRPQAKENSTALWSYYRPILQALSNIGRPARRADLEAEVERIMADALVLGDKQPMARGRQRWQVMIQRARKHMVSEGWLEKGNKLEWRITETGRRVAVETPDTDALSEH